MSKKWFDQRGDGDAVEPDVRVPEYARDYFARHDPLLAAAEGYAGRRLTTGCPTVVNVASFRANPGVAAGSLVTVLGEFPRDPEVYFGSERAAVTYAGPAQINAIAPPGSVLQLFGTGGIGGACTAARSMAFPGYGR